MEGKKENKLKVNLKFLKKTKDGHYSPIDKTSQNFIRLNESTYIDYEDQYYYGVS
ncbi:MAG: hypothetical protein ACTSWY_07825 [Promethearchaeota archaeon]